MEIAELYPKGFLARQGRDLSELSARLREVGAGFLSTLGELDDAAFYRPAAEGKWSPAQLADHLVRANTLFARALEQANRGEALLRMPRGRVTEDGRPISPDEEEPIPNRVRSDLEKDFRASLERLIAVSKGADLERVCLEQSFFGEMTGREVLQLAAWHVRHHTKQVVSGN